MNEYEIEAARLLRRCLEYRNPELADLYGDAAETGNMNYLAPREAELIQCLADVLDDADAIL